MRRRLQNEAQAAIDKADAIEVDRAAIRALAPDFPEQTPGFDAAVSSVTPDDHEADPTALAFAGDAAADADPGTESDLGFDQDDTGEQPADSPEPDSEPIPAVASADDVGFAEGTGDAEEFTFDSPEPAFADAGSLDATFGSTDAFAEQDFASSDAPAESFDTESDSSFAETDFS